MHRTLHQSKDQARFFDSLAKAVFKPRSPGEVAKDVGKAIADALTAPQGPVYIDVPADVFGEAGIPVQVVPAVPAWVDEDALADAVALVNSARTVVIWAGGGVVAADATDDLAALATQLQAPVFTTFGSRGAIPVDHPCTINLPPHEPEVEDLLAGADVLVAIGSDFDGMMTKNNTLRLPATIIDINVELANTRIGYNTVLPVVGDAKAAIRILLNSTSRRSTGLVDRLPSMREQVWARLQADPRTAESCAFVATVQQAASGVATVVNDMAIPGYWLSSYYGADRPRSVQYPIGWGTLGYALPASIGAAYGGDRPVLAVCGDGGFMYAVGELATIAQEQLPVTILLVNDGGYGMLRYDQKRAGDELRGVDLVTPDFALLAESFDISATRIENSGAELGAALERALSSNRPHMVVCDVTLFPPRTTSPRWNESPEAALVGDAE
jgi:acetolactate synthase-1/2/3 large subunit